MSSILREELIKTAYHEAGHVVIALYFGFPVKFVSIAKNVGNTIPEFGPFLPILPYVYGTSAVLPNLDSIQLENLSNFIHPLIFILMSGEICEKHHSEPGSGNIAFTETVADYDDIGRVKRCINFAEKNNIKLEYDLNGFAEEVFKFLIDPPLWEIIENLVNMLLNSKNHSLSESELDVIKQVIEKLKK